MKEKVLSNKHKILKMFLLSVSIALVNIVAFSKAFFGISIHSENTLVMTFSIFIPVMSIIIFFYEGYAILNAKEKVQYHITIDELVSSEDCKKALQKYIKIFPFLADELKILIRQIERIEVKQEALIEYLKQNNRDNTFLVQEGKEAELFLLKNVKRVLGKCIIMGALDQDDTDEDSRNVYQEQINEFHKIIKSNEKNLDEFDIFLEEVSKMGEKPLEENIGLKSTIEAMRQIRGVGSLKINKES